MEDKLTRTLFVMSFFIALAIFSGCQSNETVLSELDNGKQVAIQPGDIVSITLASNPTTGYSWQVIEIYEAVLTQKGEPEYKQNSGTQGLVGSGGTETFRFEALESGSTTLTLGYARPWESVPSLETFSISIIVQSP